MPENSIPLVKHAHDFLATTTIFLISNDYNVNAILAFVTIMPALSVGPAFLMEKYRYFNNLY